MNIKIIYGLECNDKLEEIFSIDIIKEFFGNLFFSPSINSKEAKIYIEKAIEGGVDFIEEINQINVKEIADFAGSSDDTLKDELIDMVKEWIDNLNPLNNAEITEFVNLYDINSNDTRIIKEFNSRAIPLSVSSPNDIKEKLDKFVIGQENAKREISMVFYLHLLRTKKIEPAIYKLGNPSRISFNTELPKPNMILLGPTGSGKTFIIKSLCEMLHFPFVKIDCASLTSSGYYGNGLNDYMYLLYKKTLKSIEDCKKAVIYFDEFDKLSEFHIGRDGSVGGVELQQEFLTLLEDEEYIVQAPKNSNETQIILPTRNMLFIFSGSFAGIEKIIEKKFTKSLGFGTNKGVPNDIINFVEANDFVEFGILQELIGRVNYFVPLKTLKKEDIKKILTQSSQSPVNKYLNFFYIHYDKLVIEDDVYDLIANEVIKIGAGARGIGTVLQKLMGELMFSSPNLKKETFIIDKKMFNKIFPDNK